MNWQILRAQMQKSDSLFWFFFFFFLLAQLKCIPYVTVHNLGQYLVERFLHISI